MDQRPLINADSGALPDWLYFDRHDHALLIDPSAMRNRADATDFYQIKIYGNDGRIRAEFTLRFEGAEDTDLRGNMVSAEDPYREDANNASSSEDD